jgi:hypothetical protein
MTGANAYTGLNCRLADMVQSIISDPPTANGPGPVAALVLTPTTGQISAAFTPGAGTALQIDIWLYGPHSLGRAPTITRAKHRSYTPGETSPVVISGLSPGDWTVFARFVSETDGQASSWVFASAVVT